VFLTDFEIVEGVLFGIGGIWELGGVDGEVG
jgi:hypothetical protein